MRIAAIFLACLLLAGPVFAKEATQQFVDGEPVALRDDTAYLLVRTNLIDGDYIMDAVFVRNLNADELLGATERRQADPNVKEAPNVVEMHGDNFYRSTPDERTFVLAVQPGTYILAGIATGAGAGDVCMCMGTVKFEANAGVITDLGLILMARDDKPSSISELAAHVRGKDIDVVPRLFVMGLQPYSKEMAVPETLVSLPRAVADYHASGRFPNYFGASIDRLAPVAGVLDYDKEGHVMDLKESAAVK